MRMQIVIVGEYELTDQLEERKNAYGSTDAAECADIDMQNDPVEFLQLTEETVKITMFRIDPVP